jgi:ribosomal protein S18 acetylase RimI-like enzyme
MTRDEASSQGPCAALRVCVAYCDRVRDHRVIPAPRRRAICSRSIARGARHDASQPTHRDTLCRDRCERALAAALRSRAMPPTIRPATRADHPVFVRLFPELGVDDPVPDEARWMRDMAPDTVVVEEDGVPLGVLWAHALGHVGYVRIVIVSPEARGRGVGRALMDRARDDLRAKGCTRWCLNVKEDNAPARALYERCGLATAYVSTKLRLRWDTVSRLPQSPPAITAREVDATEDAAVERAIDMPEGWFAQSRTQAMHVFLRLVDPTRPEDIVAFARFTPSFAGAFPFHAPDPRLARALLDAMQPHALPDQDDVRLIIENDAPLTKLLLEAGAVHGFDMLHLRGAL